MSRTKYWKCSVFRSRYGLCSTVCPIRFRLITFEIRRIARQADHSRDHQGCANKCCCSTSSFSATLKASKFQVVKGIILAKSAIVNKTMNTSRNVVPIEKKNRSRAYRRKESFGHLNLYICWMENLKDWNRNDVPGSVFSPVSSLFVFQINRNIRSPAERRQLSKSVV